MKKVLIAALAASLIMLCGCGETENGGDVKTVMPIDSGISIENLTDATFAGSFDESSISEENGAYNLDVEVFAEEFFDAVDITSLKAGDKLVADGTEYVVETVEQTDNGLVSINGGQEQGGVDLATNDEGGVFFVEGMDGTHTYSDLGKATLKLAENFVLTDDSDLDNPDKKYNAEEFKALLEDDSNSYGFNRVNTTVRVDNGEITEIHRIFQP